MSNSKILCLGDSITFGYEIETSKRWTNLLQNDLNLEVLNFGVNGDTTAGMLARCERLILEHQPSYFIILGGTNDLWFNLDDMQIISNIYAITRHVKYNNIEFAVGIPTPSYYLEELNLAGKNYTERINNFRNKLISFCEDRDIKYIDFGLNVSKQHFMEDGVHPNKAGQVVLKETVKSRLKRFYNL